MRDFQYNNLIQYACRLSFLDAAERHFYGKVSAEEWRMWLSEYRYEQQCCAGYLAVILNG
jgi:hypothetical protein